VGVSLPSPRSPRCRWRSACPGYTRVDLRIAKTIRGTTLAMVGQNLTRGSHVESEGTSGIVTPVPCSLHASVGWEF
jgi:hypothetical protein